MNSGMNACSTPTVKLKGIDNPTLLNPVAEQHKHHGVFTETPSGFMAARELWLAASVAAQHHGRAILHISSLKKDRN